MQSFSAFPVLVYPFGDQPRHVSPFHVNVRVPLRIVRPQKLEREQYVAFDEVDVDEIHRCRIGGVSCGGRGEADAGLDGVGDAVECDGGVEGVVAVGARVVGRGVARCELVDVVVRYVVVVCSQRSLVTVGEEEQSFVYLGVSARSSKRAEDGPLVCQRVRGGPELGYRLVDDLEEPLGDAEGHVLDVAEAAGKGADGVGRVDREWALEDVKP